VTIVTGQAEAPDRSEPARSGMLRQVWEHRADYAYVLPAILVMLIVIAYPI
jgi:multiple sugar transport system permease protein